MKAEHKEEMGEYEEAHGLLLKMAIQKPESSARIKIVHLAIRRGQDKDSVLELYITAYHNMMDKKEASNIMLQLARYLQTKGCCKDAIHCLDQGIENNMNWDAESLNCNLYSAKIDLMKFVEPPKVLEICDDAIMSEMNYASKMKFAEEKVDMAQLLGASHHVVKEAKQEVERLRKKCADSRCDSSSGEHNKEKVKEFVCDKCSEKFMNSRNLTYHQRAMHSCDEKCDRCDSIFEDKGLLLKHKQSKTCFWQCEHCKYKSLKKSDVAKHVKRIHNKNIAGIMRLESTEV